MPLEIIIALIGAVVPGLVGLAEKQFGDQGSGAKKRQWVIDGVHEFMLAAVKHVPAWARPAPAIIEPLIDETIEFALEKLGI